MRDVGSLSRSGDTGALESLYAARNLALKGALSPRCKWRLSAQRLGYCSTGVHRTHTFIDMLCHLLAILASVLLAALSSSVYLPLSAKTDATLAVADNRFIRSVRRKAAPS